MKKIKILTICTALLLSTFTFTGCMSMVMGAVMESSLANDFRKDLEKQEVKYTPENSILFFGTGYMSVSLIQQNPELGVRKIGSTGMSASGRSYFVFMPIPLNSELLITSATYPISNGTMTIRYGIAGVDFVANKPGLLYFDDNDPKHVNEKRALDFIKDFYKETEWEPLIEARLQELK